MLHVGSFHQLQAAGSERHLHCEHFELRGIDTTSLTYFRDLNYTSDRSSCDVPFLGNENLYCRQTSSCKQSWATTSSAHDFSNVTKNATNESPEIQMSPGDSWLWKRQRYIQLFLSGQLRTTAEELHADFVCSLENYLILSLNINCVTMNYYNINLVLSPDLMYRTTESALYLFCQAFKESSGNVNQVFGSRNLGIHVFDANQFADGDDSSVAMKTIPWEGKI